MFNLILLLNSALWTWYCNNVFLRTLVVWNRLSIVNSFSLLDRGGETWIIRVLPWGVLDGIVRCSLPSWCLVSGGRRAPLKACYFGWFWHKYADIFQDPKQLPPHRAYDHDVPLYPDAVPVNAIPYHYSPQHKTEIENQVKQLLEAGLITHSHSPFATLVLLVKKKDGNWRFCVDYRKLNATRFKNRFPMPIVEEILDELAG